MSVSRSSSLQQKSENIPRIYSHHEEQKKRAYNAWILDVEKGVLTPLVFSTSGGMGEEAKILFRGMVTDFSGT